MGDHLEALAAQEHRSDTTMLSGMCASVRSWLDPDPDDGIARVVRHELDLLTRDLAQGRLDRDAGRLRLRRLVAVAGAARARDHTQSPVADGSTAVDGEWWDYRRDRHRDGACWERQWIDRIVGPQRGATAADPRLGALLTSCGMAAVTTVVALLERETGQGPIVVDESTYHETRHLLATGALAGRLRVVPSDELVEAIGDLAPAAVVVDAVSNSIGVRVADLDRVSAALGSARAGGRARDDGPLPVLVADVSVCSTASPAVGRLLGRSAADETGHRSVVVESLTKHAQLGLDRVTAGVIVAHGSDVIALDRLREHLGTNVADLSCLQLLPPDRGRLRARLDRVGRNAELMAAALATAGAPVVHPSRPDHPDHGRWRRLRPSVGVVTIADDDCPAGLIDRWRSRARARGVPLDHGAGFGFDTTRIYRTSATVPEATRFVRIAPGAEPIDTALAVADVLASAWR